MKNKEYTKNFGMDEKILINVLKFGIKYFIDLLKYVWDNVQIDLYFYCFFYILLPSLISFSFKAYVQGGPNIISEVLSYFFILSLNFNIE